MKKFLLLLAALIIVVAVGQKTKLLSLGPLEQYFQPSSRTPQPSIFSSPGSPQKVKIVNEESVITDVVQKSLPSVVTIGINTTVQTNDSFQINPFDPFQPFQQVPGQQQQVKQNIGSGFIVSSDGLIITNKHVVSDTTATYQVLTNDNKKYDVQKIYRDPLNDLAILKINPPAGGAGLKPLPLGDSSHLKLGQTVIAIGTPLGEFTNTVTSGIISGLGRGITAGSPLEGYVEKLDNVIQTDAAISPGNSGGPLLDSAGQVIGINTAIAQGGQNIGFAIPVNVIKNLLATFNKNGGSFVRPYVGVRYKMIDKQTALLNDVVQGAYIVQVIQGSPADKAGLQQDDIITEFGDTKINGGDEQSLTKLLANKKPGDSVTLKVWRNGSIKIMQLTLGSST